MAGVTEVSFHRSMQSTAPSRPCPPDAGEAPFEILTIWKWAGVRSDATQITSYVVNASKNKVFYREGETRGHIQQLSEVVISSE